MSFLLLYIVCLLEGMHNLYFCEKQMSIAVNILIFVAVRIFFSVGVLYLQRKTGFHSSQRRGNYAQLSLLFSTVNTYTCHLEV